MHGCVCFSRKARMDGECLRSTSSYGWYRKQVADEPRCLLWGIIAHAPPRVPLNHFEYGIEYLRVMYESIDISPYRIIMEIHHFNARVITRDRLEAKMALPGTWARCSWFLFRGKFVVRLTVLIPIWRLLLNEDKYRYDSWIKLWLLQTQPNNTTNQQHISNLPNSQSILYPIQVHT